MYYMYVKIYNICEQRRLLSKGWVLACSYSCGRSDYGSCTNSIKRSCFIRRAMPTVMPTNSKTKEREKDDKKGEGRQTYTRHVRPKLSCSFSLASKVGDPFEPACLRIAATFFLSYDRFAGREEEGTLSSLSGQRLF